MKTRAIRHNNETAPAQERAGLAGRSFPVQVKRDAGRSRPGYPNLEGTDQAASRPGASFGKAPVFPEQPRFRDERSGNPLPKTLQQKMEATFRTDFSDVRVHQGPAADSLSALAFTQGRDIHFAPGRYNPSSLEGQKIIAHELTHVVQQRQGRVAMPQGKGAPVNANSALEAEADALGEKTVRGEAVSMPGAGHQAKAAAGYQNNVPIQGMTPSPGGGKKEGAGGGRRDDEDEEIRPPSHDYGIQSTPEFQERLGIMREALQVDAQHRDRRNVGFPFQFFEHAFGTSQQEASFGVSGRGMERREVEVPNSATDIDRILPMLPTTMTKGGHLQRILEAGDLSQLGRDRQPGQVSMDRVREAMTGQQFALNRNLDLSTLHQPSAQIDFEARDRDTGRNVQFDPFASPQPKALTARNRLALQLEGEGVDRAALGRTGHYPGPPHPRAQLAEDRRWAEGAYREHTNQSKGPGVIGVWDQTSDSDERITALNQAVKGSGAGRGLVQPVDLRLDEEYVLEDRAARFQIEARKRRAEAEEERQQEVKRSKSREGKGADRPTGQEALPWGGPGPGAIDPYGWGQNHPLYLRYRREDDDSSGAST